MLFSSKRRRKPGPKGPSAELVHAVVEMKQRNPHWGCPRIAQQIAVVFHIPIDKDVVCRIASRKLLPDGYRCLTGNVTDERVCHHVAFTTWEAPWIPR